MAVLLTRYLIQYHRVVSYFSEMEKTEDTELNNILDEICTDKEKRNIKIVQTAAVEIPCCIGIFEKRIKNIRVKNCIILFYMNIHIWIIRIY